MKSFLKFFIPTVTTLGLGLLGLFVGTDYGGSGGDFGCFMEQYYGYPGYEACGSSYGIMGLVLGLAAGLLIAKAIKIK